MQNGTKVADDDWSVDTSAEAVKQRMEDLSSQATNLALTSDLEKSTSERVNMFFKFVEVCAVWVCVRIMAHNDPYMSTCVSIHTRTPTVEYIIALHVVMSCSCRV